MSTTTSEKLLREMLANAVHFGHRPSKWNPKMASYIHGKHSGVHVFDLNKTASALKTASDFLSGLSKEGKTILFVSTKQQAVHIVEEVATQCGMPHITHKWVPGLLTNFSTIKERIKYLKDLKDQESKGEFEKYTKKEALNLHKTIIKLQTALGGVQEMSKRPDALFIVDVVRDKIAVKEAAKLGIPIVGIVDSNADPSEIDFPIPGNDDAILSIGFLTKKIGEAIGKKKTAPVKN
jgi:small subunit ribosomal protein S2